MFKIEIIFADLTLEQLQQLLWQHRCQSSIKDMLLMLLDSKCIKMMQFTICMQFRYQACLYFLLQLVVFSSFIFPRKFILLHWVRKLITLQQMKLLLVNCNLYLKQVAVEQVLELILTRCEVDRLPENCCHLQGQYNFFLYFKIQN